MRETGNMERILTTRTVVPSELQKPAQVIEAAGGNPVAVVEDNVVVGYFVPAVAVEKVSFKPATTDAVRAALDATRERDAKIIEGLKDK